MMKNILEYKGYYAKVEYSSEDKVLFGKIEGINDLVNFESDSTEGIEKEFREAVDDYLEFCKEVGKEPDKIYKGTFNVRINPELHKQIALIALKNGDTLNKTIEKALEEYAKSTTRTEVVLCEKIDMLSEQLSAQTTTESEEDGISFPLFDGLRNMRMQYS